MPDLEKLKKEIKDKQIEGKEIMPRKSHLIIVTDCSIHNAICNYTGWDLNHRRSEFILEVVDSIDSIRLAKYSDIELQTTKNDVKTRDDITNYAGAGGSMSMSSLFAEPKYNTGFDYVIEQID